MSDIVIVNEEKFRKILTEEIYGFFGKDKDKYLKTFHENRELRKKNRLLKKDLNNVRDMLMSHKQKEKSIDSVTMLKEFDDEMKRIGDFV